VALVKMGANGVIETTTATQPVEAIVLTNAGQMATSRSRARTYHG
jgi:hypothetical protein